jgi:hypothetical protein
MFWVLIILINIEFGGGVDEHLFLNCVFGNWELNNKQLSGKKFGI